MTSPLDLGLLEQFSFILPLLLVYAVIVGILAYWKMFNSAVNNIIAIAIALMMLIAPGAMEVIKFIAPWATVMLVIVLLVLMFVKVSGVEDNAIKEAFKNHQLAYWVMTVFAILIIAGLGKVYFGSGQFLDEDKSAVDAISNVQGTSSAGEKKFWETIFHPNVLGFILVMLIAVFTITSLSSGQYS